MTNGLAANSGLPAYSRGRAKEKDQDEEHPNRCGVSAVTILAAGCGGTATTRHTAKPPATVTPASTQPSGPVLTCADLAPELPAVAADMRKQNKLTREAHGNISSDILSGAWTPPGTCNIGA